MFSLRNIDCVEYFSSSVCHKHLLFAMRAVNPMQNCSWVWPICRKILCISCSLTICLFSRTAITAAWSSCLGIDECRIGALLHLPTRKAKSAGSSLWCNDYCATQHIVSSDASANTCNSIFSIAALKYLRSVFVSASTGLPHLCHICGHIRFNSFLIWTLKGANKSTGPKTEETMENCFLCVTGSFISFFVPLHTWKLSSATVHWSPPTQMICLPWVQLQSISFGCLIASALVLLLLQLHCLLYTFLNQNHASREIRSNWLHTSTVSSSVCRNLVRLSI